MRSMRSGVTISSRDRPKEGGHLYGGLFDASRRLLGRQLRGDEVRGRVHASTAHRGLTLHSRRYLDVLPPPHPGASGHAQTERPSLRGGPGVPRGGDRPDSFHLRREHDQCCQHRSHIRHCPHLGTVPEPDARVGDAHAEGVWWAWGFRSWVSGSSSTRASGPRVRAWPEISSCSLRRWRSGATPYSRCRCWSVTRRWRWRPTHCSSEGWSSCCSVHRTLPVWSGGASASEHGRLWASRRSSRPLSPSRPGKRAYPASGPTEFWSTNI